MIWYLLIIDKNKSTEYSIFYKKRTTLAEAINKYRNHDLDVMVFEGTMTDRQRNYLMTLDPKTLKDKGY